MTTVAVAVAPIRIVGDTGRARPVIVTRVPPAVLTRFGLSEVTLKTPTASYPVVSGTGVPGVEPVGGEVVPAPGLGVEPPPGATTGGATGGVPVPGSGVPGVTGVPGAAGSAGSAGSARSEGSPGVPVPGSPPGAGVGGSPPPGVPGAV